MADGPALVLQYPSNEHRGIKMEIRDIFHELPELETERLILRKVTENDVTSMYEYGNDPEVSKYVTWERHLTLSDTEDYLNFVLENYQEGRLAPWAIEYKADGKMIGTIDFVQWKPSHQVAEIGYVLHREYWGKGIMTEAANRVIQFGFEHMDLVRIQAVCLPENTGSFRVMEKAGLTYEGTLKKARKIKGKNQDIKMYAIVK